MAELLRVLWACSGLIVCAVVTWVYWRYLPRKESDDSRGNSRQDGRGNSGSGRWTSDDAENP